MEKIAFIQISTSLFLLNFFFHYAIIKNKDKTAMLDLIPFLVLIGTSKLDVIHTEFTIYKIALFTTLILKSWFYLSGKNITRDIYVIISLITSVSLISGIAFKINLPVVLINALLIVSCVSVLIIKVMYFNSSHSKNDKEIVEIGFIGFVGALALGIGNSSYNLYMGLAVMIIFQMSEIAISLKHYASQTLDVKGRLNDLEERFERTVEFEAKKRTAIMADKVEYIREKSQKDPLSKAFNRNGITNEINALINDSSIKIFSIALFDIDFFKSINDTKGHVVGDECIKFLSYLFMSNNRKTDLLGRYGGDEFILLMPHVNAPAAIEICDRLRKEVSIKSSPKFSISMGIATYPYDGRTFTELLEAADKSLYHAKESGRNKVSYIGSVPIIKK